MTETPDHVLTKRAVLEALPPHACVDNPFPFAWHAFWTTPAGLWDIRRNGHTGTIRILGPKVDVTLADPTADTVLATLWLHSALGEDPAFHADAERLIAEVGKALAKMPRIVVLCGSTRFAEAFRTANLSETLAGRIVLSIGCDMRSDAELFAHLGEAEVSHIKAGLDELHLRKIDLADEVLVLNVGGYVGESTRREIDYAISQGKVIRWLEPGREDTPEALAERMDSIRHTDGTPFVACKAPSPINPLWFCLMPIGHQDICWYVPADQLPASADDEGDETETNRCAYCGDVITLIDGKWAHRPGLRSPHDAEPSNLTAPRGAE